MKLFGASKGRQDFVNRLGLQNGDKILDIGCGPADIVAYLPEYVEYTGFDNNKNYINSAKKRFKNRGNFLCEEVSSDLSSKSDLIKPESFNIALAIGVLHHLTDEQATNLFELAKTSLVKGGKLVTLDGCFTENQSLFTKFFLKMDRGNFVRNENSYVKLAKQNFEEIKVDVFDNQLINIPYTYIIMECIK